MAGALVSLLKGGERIGVSKGVLDERTEGKKGKRKTNAVKLRGGYGRWVPVEDRIATTGAMTGMGCDEMGFECKRDRGWGAVKEG